MPLLRFKTALRVKEDWGALALNALHVLRVGEQNYVLYNLRGPLQPCIDVRLRADLVLAISLVVDGRRSSSKDVQQSTVTTHLINYLRKVRRTKVPPGEP